MQKRGRGIPAKIENICVCYHQNRGFLLIGNFLSMHTALFSTQLLQKDRACLNPLRFGYYTQVPSQIPVLFNSVVSFLISSACSASRISTLARRGAVCLSSHQVSPEDKALFHGAYESVTRLFTPESLWELRNENPKDHEQPHPPLITKTR